MMRRSSHNLHFTPEQIETFRAEIDALELPSVGSSFLDTYLSHVAPPLMSSFPAETSSDAHLRNEGSLSKGDKLREDVVVVASQINACESNVPDDLRELVHSVLLIAQLAARKKDADNADAYWTKYWESLVRIGWLDVSVTEVKKAIVKTDVSVHEQIETILLASVPGFEAAPIVSAFLHSLKDVNPNSSWITLFHHSARKTNGASFQFSDTQMGPGNVITLDLVGIFLDANVSCTQVLFFKYPAVDASLRIVRKRLQTTPGCLKRLAKNIKKKAKPYYAREIASIMDL